MEKVARVYDYQKAYSYTVKLLTGRDFSEKKLKEKLFQKKVSKEICEKIIDEIKMKGFLREENYVEARIKAFMNKGYSKKYILQKISQEAQMIDIEFINNLFTEYRVTEEDQINKLIEKKMPNVIPSQFDDNRKLFQKIFRFIISKGHNSTLGFKLIKSKFSTRNDVFELVTEDMI
jgi:regulatory protein